MPGVGSMPWSAPTPEKNASFSRGSCEDADVDAGANGAAEESDGEKRGGRRRRRREGERDES